MSTVKPSGDANNGICPSCAAPGMRQFCAVCGERALTGHDFSMAHFLLHTLPHELFHVEGKLARTLTLLIVKPGFLAAEYVRGRRTPYINPVRLYVIAFVLHFAVAGLGATHPDSLRVRVGESDPTGIVERLMDARPQIDWDSPLTRERLGSLGHWLSEGGTMLIFLGIAFVLLLLFRRPQRRYLEHATLALYVCTFFVLFVTLETGVGTLLGRGFGIKVAQAISNGLDLVVLSVYWYFSIRTFYGLRGWWAPVSALVVTAAHVVLGQAFNVTALAILVESAGR